MQRDGDILILSNGHGEDAVGSRIARALIRKQPNIAVLAYPTVGDGAAYTTSAIRLHGSRTQMPSGGLTFGSPRLLWRDLRAGLPMQIGRQLRELRATRVSTVVTVGDVWAEILGSFPRAQSRHAVQTLVTSATEEGGTRFGMHTFRDRFTLLERSVLRMRYQSVFVRDEATMRRLGAAGIRNVQAPGNPMLDGLEASPLAWDAPRPRVALLPGTRAWAASSLPLMCDALARLPAAYGAVAWAGNETPEPPTGWTQDQVEPGILRWRKGAAEVRLYPDHFAHILAWADVVLGTSGTAQEQAVGVGVPVLTFAHGSGFTTSFLAKQRRLLGDAIEIVPAAAEAVAAALAALLADPVERERRAEIGRQRMGRPGGSDAIADAILAGFDGYDGESDASRGVHMTSEVNP